LPVVSDPETARKLQSKSRKGQGGLRCLSRPRLILHDGGSESAPRTLPHLIIVSAQQRPPAGTNETVFLPQPEKVLDDSNGDGVQDYVHGNEETGI
jgi:hypothetical protein